MNSRNYGISGLRASFCLSLCFVLAGTLSHGQTAPTVYTLTTLQKVEQVNTTEYEKVMVDYWKAVHQLRKQNGKITNWALYRVRFAGASNEYNYVTVSYYDSFAKTEPNDNYPELMKAANPKADAAAILSQTLKARTLQRAVMYRRVDATNPAAAPKPRKYVMINFMQPKSGMNADYVKIEREDFKPVHQARVNSGSMVGWGLYTLVHPWGSSNDHQFVTADVYADYAQLGEDMEPYWKKLNPGKEIQPLFDKLEKSRNAVRTELWELVTATD